MIFEFSSGVKFEVKELMAICSSVSDADNDYKWGTNISWGIINDFRSYMSDIFEIDVIK
jgi:hypothetical protein